MPPRKKRQLNIDTLNFSAPKPAVKRSTLPEPIPVENHVCYDSSGSTLQSFTPLETTSKPIHLSPWQRMPIPDRQPQQQLLDTPEDDLEQLDEQDRDLEIVGLTKNISGRKRTASV